MSRTQTYADILLNLPVDDTLKTFIERHAMPLPEGWIWHDSIQASKSLVGLIQLHPNAAILTYSGLPVDISYACFRCGGHSRSFRSTCPVHGTKVRDSRIGHCHRLEYEDPRGNQGLCKALQARLSQTRGLSCSVEQLMIVNGSSQALDLGARLLVNPGDDVVVENPGYQMGHRVFEAYGTNLHVVNVDDQVLVTDHLRLLIKIS